MNVTGNHHRIGDLAIVDVLQKPRAIGGIAVPIVGPERVDSVLISAQLRHQHILRDQIPSRLAAREPGIEPSLLAKAEHGAAGVEPLRTTGISLQMSATLVGRRITGLARAVLPAVDDGYFDETAQGETVIDPHQRNVWSREDRPHRHMFVKSLIGRGAPEQELRRIVERLRPFIGIIVLHFVIVPGDDGRHLRVQLLQVGIEPVLGIAIAISRQGRCFDTIAVAANDRPVLLDGLVDVVAEEQDEFGIFAGQVR